MKLNFCYSCNTVVEHEDDYYCSKCKTKGEGMKTIMDEIGIRVEEGEIEDFAEWLNNRPSLNYNKYSSLRDVLCRAYLQASDGKGKKRHANENNFEDQPIVAISKLLNSNDGPLFQAMKKIQESKRLEKDRAINELLGAINYIAAAIIYLEQEK